MTKNLLANNEGQKLIEHLEKVSELSAQLACDLGLNGELIEIAKIAGLLHDIGKAEKGFQEFIKSKTEDDFILENEDKKDDFPLHNEIGWAFLAKNGFNFSKNDTNYTDIILNVVYWHHGIPSYKHIEQFNKIKPILDGKDTKQIQELCENFKIQLNQNNCKKNDEKIPEYIIECPDEDGFPYNALLFCIRAIVVKADRLISKGKEIQYFTPQKIENVQRPKNYEEARFNFQKDISCEASQNKITQINAPAGFGKTLIGLLWHIKLDKKTYWVVPRNTIARGVYENLYKEIEALNLDISVELFLTGEQKSKNKECDIYDITVTNIDNLMAPIVNMNRAEMAYDAFASNIIFDEYHEFAQKNNGIYAAFITMMIARNELITKSNTLLLSATSCVHNLIWEKHSKNKTHIISDCNPSHNKIYNLSAIDSELSAKTPNSWLYIHNTIKNTQNAWVEDHETKIFHSAYTEEHKEIHNKQLLKDYGKNEIRTHSTDKVAAAPIIQAALDISFANLAESVLSPESTIQRIGRCNRWGYAESANIVLYTGADKSTAKAIENIFDKEIRDLWINFVKNNFTGQKTLKEIYSLYKKFNIDNEAALEKYYMNLYNKFNEGSISALSKIIPKRYHRKSDGKIIASNNPTLRALKPSLFFIVKDYYTRKWMPYNDGKSVMSMEKAELEKISNDSGFTKSMIKTIIKDLVSMGYKAYTITDKKGTYIKKSLKDGVENSRLLFMAKDKEMPYPVPQKDYLYYYNEVDKRGLVKLSTKGEKNV